MLNENHVINQTDLNILSLIDSDEWLEGAAAARASGAAVLRLWRHREVK